MQLNIITLGCSKNTVDSEKVLAQMAAAGYEVVYDQFDYESDVVVINTCGFINDAKEESVDTIIQYVDAKKRGDIDKLYVIGCLSERYMDDLRLEIPEVDDYFGVNSIEEIVRGMGSDFRKDILPDRILSGPSHYAYLKISEGCDRTCSFCAIPRIRGKYHSRPIEELYRESEILVKGGVKELILIAQDLSYYGLDLYKEQRLPELVEKISGIEGLEWIRLHYLYPANFPLEIIDIMNSNPKVCKYIDLPVQHISERMLGSMRRSHTGQETRALLDNIRAKLPAAAIRTTLISGHPGESEEDFTELLDYIKDFRFDRLGVFTYSHEEDTFGQQNYSDDVPEDVKASRRDILMEVQQEISYSKNQEMIGTSMKVIIDRVEGLYFYGRSEFDSPEVDQEIMIPINKSKLKVGDFTNVKITSASEFDLVGEIRS